MFGLYISVFKIYRFLTKWQLFFKFLKMCPNFVYPPCIYSLIDTCLNTWSIQAIFSIQSLYFSLFLREARLSRNGCIHSFLHISRKCCSLLFLFPAYFKEMLESSVLLSCIFQENAGVLCFSFLHIFQGNAGVICFSFLHIFKEYCSLMFLFPAYFSRKCWSHLFLFPVYFKEMLESSVSLFCRLQGYAALTCSSCLQISRNGCRLTSLLSLRRAISWSLIAVATCKLAISYLRWCWSTPSWWSKCTESSPMQGVTSRLLSLWVANS